MPDHVHLLVEGTIRYVIENLVRGGLVTAWRDYPFSGTSLPLV